MSSTLHPNDVSNLSSSLSVYLTALQYSIRATESESRACEYLGDDVVASPSFPVAELSGAGSGGTEIASNEGEAEFAARFAPDPNRKPIIEIALNIPESLGVDVDTVEEIVPSGAEARVFRAHSSKFNRMVIVKRFEGSNGLACRHATRESKNLSRLQGHPYIIRLLDVVHVQYFSFVVLEHGGKDLRKWRHDHAAQVSEETVRQIAMRALLVLKYLRDNGWCHGDLKLENMVIDEDGHLRLIDIGLSPRLGDGEDLYEEIRTNVGTPGLQPPEQLMHGVLTLQSDLFNLGVILASLLTKRSYKLELKGEPDKKRQAEDFKKWRDRVHDDLVNLGISRRATKFIVSMLTIRPRDRPTAEQLLGHPWVHDIQELEAEVQAAALHIGPKVNLLKRKAKGPQSSRPSKR